MASLIAQTSLSGVLSVATGSTIDFSTARKSVSSICACTGTITGGVIVIEGSHNATSWVQLYQHVMVDSTNQQFNLNEGAYRYFRAKVVSAITGGGSVTVTFMEAD